MDLALAYNAQMGKFDLALDGYDLATDSGLRSAVIDSLFTDRRADADDDVPDGTTDRRGSWMDNYADVSGDQMGSRLWLLHRATTLPAVLVEAEQYAREALAWMIDDGVAHAVTVTAERVNGHVLGLRVEIARLDGSRFDDLFRYSLEAT